MIVISHRGNWSVGNEKNSISAFERAFSLGLGVETDIRDFDGKLVISHDPASQKCIKFEDLLKLYLRYPTRPTLALNIKADGLQVALQSELELFGIKNYFLFDMAVPDALLYARFGMNIYTRHSEYEPVPAYYEKACGVWLDEFDSHWLSNEVIEKHICAGKAICIVSPELHKRSHKQEWNHYRELEKKIGKNKLMLCTDLPDHANEFFNA